MSARALVLAIVVLAAVPAAAPAKGVIKLKVCGPERCLSPIGPDTYPLFEGPREPARAPAGTAPHYLMTWEQFVPNSVDFEPVRARYVPSAGLLQMADGAWERPDRRAVAALKRAMAGVKPFGVPKPRPAPVQAQAGSGGVSSAALAGAGLLLAGGAAVAVRRRRRPAG
jgi:LPXTG-motif cell wall-anchored protein